MKKVLSLLSLLAVVNVMGMERPPVQGQPVVVDRDSLQLSKERTNAQWATTVRLSVIVATGMGTACYCIHKNRSYEGVMWTTLAALYLAG